MKKRFKLTVLSLISIPLFMVGCDKTDTQIDRAIVKAIEENVGEFEFTREKINVIDEVKIYEDTYTITNKESSIYKEIYIVRSTNQQTLHTKTTLNGTNFDNLDFLTWMDDIHKMLGDKMDTEHIIQPYINIYNEALNKCKTNIGVLDSGNKGSVQIIQQTINEKYAIVGFVLLDIDANETLVHFSVINMKNYI